MKILDWYILKKFLTTFVFVVLIMVSVVLIITYSERSGIFIKYDISSQLIAGYFLNYAPYIAITITPITVFIAVIFVTSRLASHTEVVAILSGGVSYFRFLRPFLVGASIIAIASFILTGWVIPNANKSRVAFEDEYFDTGIEKKETDMHLKVSPTTYAYLEKYSFYRNSGTNFTLEEIEDKQLRWKLSAKQISWDSVAHVWKLSDWDLRGIKAFGESYHYEDKRDTILKINLTPDDFRQMKGQEETLNLDELEDHIADLKLKGADHIPIYEIERLMRYMSPFTALILTFIGVSLSSRKTRGGMGFQIALGFLLAFIFILFFMTTRSMAQTGAMNTVLAVWLPNITFTILGLLLYRFLPK